MKQFLINLCKILVSLALLAFLLARIDIAELLGVLSNVNPWLFLLALALYFLAIVIGAVKWQVLVKAQEIDASVGALLSYSLVGLFFGNFLPSNVGSDVIRAYDLARATPGKGEAAAISVLVDRLMGLVAFFTTAVVMASLAAAMLAQVTAMREIELATVGAAILFLVACTLLFSRRLARRFAFLFDTGPFRRFKPVAQKVYSALQVYRFRYRALGLNIALSLLIVAITALVWYVVGRSVGIDSVSFFYYLLFNPLIAFVLLIPISFNGLGPKEAAAVFFFGLIGVSHERALSMSLLFHLIIVLTSLPGGVLWLRTRSLVPAPPSPENPRQAPAKNSPAPVASQTAAIEVKTEQL